MQETARRGWHRAWRAAVRARCSHRPAPFPQDPDPPAAGRADRGGQARARGADPSPDLRPVDTPLLPSRPPRSTASGRAPGAPLGRERARAPPPGKGLRRRGRARAAAPRLGRPSLGKRAPAAPHSPGRWAGAGGLRAPRRVRTRTDRQDLRGEASTPPPPPNVRQPPPTRGHREEDAARQSVRAAPTVLTPSGRRRSPGSPVCRAPTPLLSLRRRLGAPLAPLALFVFVLFYPVTRGRRRGVYWPRGGRPVANRGGGAAAEAARQSQGK